MIKNNTELISILLMNWTGSRITIEHRDSMNAGFDNMKCFKKEIVKMAFNLVDIENWNRKEHYLHYSQQLRCTYSLTTTIDITLLKQEMKNRNKKIYPALIYMITTAVNQHKEFRMDNDHNGHLGYWDEVNPSYTILNEEKQIFSSIWTEYDSSFRTFYTSCVQDSKTYSDSTFMAPKPKELKNIFTISSIPWIEFTSFNLNVYNEGSYLPPIFTIGKFTKQNDRTVMPVAIQVHHAVCDGFHLGSFIASLENLADSCLDWIQ